MILLVNTKQSLPVLKVNTNWLSLVEPTEQVSCSYVYILSFLADDKSRILCLWFRTSLIYINNCPTRCNTIVYLLFCKFTLHVSGVNHTHYQEYTKLFFEETYCLHVYVNFAYVKLSIMHNLKFSLPLSILQLLTSTVSHMRLASCTIGTGSLSRG